MGLILSAGQGQGQAKQSHQIKMLHVYRATHILGHLRRIIGWWHSFSDLAFRRKVKVNSN